MRFLSQLSIGKLQSNPTERSIGKILGLDAGKYVLRKQTVEKEDKVASSEDQYKKVSITPDMAWGQQIQTTPHVPSRERPTNLMSSMWTRLAAIYPKRLQTRDYD